MFKNIGKKIKKLSEIMCLLGIGSSVGTGLVLIFRDTDSLNDITLISSFLIIIFGSLFSWIGSFFSYGFGELIDNSSKLIELNKKNTAPAPAIPKEENLDIKAKKTSSAPRMEGRRPYIRRRVYPENQHIVRPEKEI